MAGRHDSTSNFDGGNDIGSVINKAIGFPATTEDNSPKRKTDFAGILAKSRVSEQDQIEEDPVCISILENGYSRPIGTLGSFSMVIGKAKSRKTFFISVLIACLLVKKAIWGKIQGLLPVDRPTVLYFDTEQGRYHISKVLKRIQGLTGLNRLLNLETYALRPYSPGDRLGAIQHAIENTPNVGAVIIDGIRDTVLDINSAEEATEIATALLKWTEERKMHLITVLHQNKGDNNARGHLGTELVNKSDAVLSVARDTGNKEYSLVTPEQCRDRDFEPFLFAVDENGLPFLVPDQPMNSTGSAGKKKNEITASDFSAIVGRVFALNPELSYGKLIPAIKEASEFLGKGFGESAAEKFVVRAMADGHIIKSDSATGKSRYPVYRGNPAKYLNSLTETTTLT